MSDQSERRRRLAGQVAGFSGRVHDGEPDAVSPPSLPASEHLLRDSKIPHRRGAGGYAEQAGFGTVTEVNREPYADGTFPAYLHDYVINFSHFAFPPANP